MRSNLGGMQQELDQVFDRFFGGGMAAPRGTWNAPLSVWEDAERVCLEIEMPGVAKDDLQLTAAQCRLEIVAERKLPDAQRHYWHSERAYGRYERVIALPDTVDPGSLQAELRDGVLTVTMAKRPEAQPRRISVNAS
jgi:HSP20 family protein